MTARATTAAGPATEAVADACARIEAANRAEVWIELRGRDALLAEARDIDRRCAEAESLPLAGHTLAVKDNIDVAGLPTTAGCPAFAYRPQHDARVVAALRRAGAIVLGKTNLDQFATGLVGTRSPYGAVRDARDPRRVAGGSSSGSAVAVAMGMADIGVGTDTAGSGRVPAAFQGVFGLKPTRDLLSRDGVVPACRSFDCVSLFAADLDLAELALSICAGYEPATRDGSPTRRAARGWQRTPWPSHAPLRAPARPRIAIAADDQLRELSPEFRVALDAATQRLEAAGAELTVIDIGPLVQAGALLYDGALVAERYAAVGEFIDAHADDVDSVVASIIGPAGAISATRYLADWERLRDLRACAAETLAETDALMLPTAPCQPTIAEVAGDPVHVNRRLGRYTTFCNLLDMCAVAVPAGPAGAGRFGVSLLAPGFHDRVVLDLAHRFVDTEPRRRRRPQTAAGLTTAPPSVDLLVVGAHLSGQPLNSQLLALDGVLVGPAETAPRYRLYRLRTDPPKPGLIRCGSGDPGGGSIAGELWSLAPAALAQLLADLPRPMCFGHVELADGSEVVGFLCEPEAVAGAEEITASGSWPAHLALT
ncbi:MAG TPA: allophanate hydrolase [Solirubrobacteraceae bacterium]|nr:allophanate hydrolase [Solirubrobacteraceae bacterium]